ncbi:MAG: hypothetical protein DMG84_20195 [Acidobacteria bacterium]|nr:MAG: hypothetical protein DMG84_20195 [Acidobacteriota bacterium]
MPLVILITEMRGILQWAEQELSKGLTILRTGNEALQVASTNLNEVLLEISSKTIDSVRYGFMNRN